MAREGTLDVEPMDEGTRRAVEETVARIDQSWTGLTEVMDGIPAERLEEPGVSGEWSVKDLIAHVAFWDAQAMEKIHRRAAGEPVRTVDWQAMNDREAAASRSRSLDDLRAELHQAHRQLLDVLGTLPPTDPMTADVCSFVPDDTYEHYDEHAAEIRAWRERVGV